MPLACPHVSRDVGQAGGPAGLIAIPWLKWLVLLNPLVYMSEGLRAALTPDVPHMPTWAFLSALTLATLLLGGIGVRGFVRRTIS